MKHVLTISSISLYLVSDGTAFLLGLLVVIGIFIPSISCATRMLHDINNSACLVLRSR